MPKKTAPLDAWKHLKSAQIQIDHCDAFPGNGPVAILARMGVHEQFSYLAHEDKDKRTFHSLIKMPIDPTVSKLVLDMVDIDSKTIIGRAKLNLLAVSESARDRKKIYTTIPMASTFGEPIMVNVGVRLIPDAVSNTSCKTFSSNPTSIPTLKKAELHREQSFKEGRMKLVRVPRSGPGSPTGPRTPSPISPNNRGGESTRIFKPTVAGGSESEEDVIGNPMEESFYQDLSKKDGFEFIAQKH